MELRIANLRIDDWRSAADSSSTILRNVQFAICNLQFEVLSIPDARVLGLEESRQQTIHPEQPGTRGAGRDRLRSSAGGPARANRSWSR